MSVLIYELVLSLVVAALIGWLVARLANRLRYTALTEKLQALQNDNIDLQAYHDRAEAEFKELRADKARRLQVVTRQKSEILRLEKVIGELESERNELNGQLRQLRATLEEQQAALQAEMNTYAEQKDILKKDRQKVAAQFADQEARMEILQGKLEETSHALKTANEKSEMLQLRNIHLVEENEQLLKKQLETEARRDALLDEQKELLTRYKSLEKQAEVEQEKKQKLLEAHTHLAEQHTLLQRENSDLQRQLDTINADMEDLTTQIIDVRNERDGLSGRLRSIMSIAGKIEADQDSHKQG